jgi:uncharacterized protein YbgA (DUF1722 family)/uncharacterized protein YbbK (DUF523 family)
LSRGHSRTDTTNKEMNMGLFSKPRLVVSKCIEFDFCRYNGQIIRSEIVSSLKPHVEFLPICPELEIGLGVPRDPIRIIEKQHKKVLFQPNTNRDVSKEMQQFAQQFLLPLQQIDGFLLKSQSPSCGTRDVKIYPAAANTAAIRRNAGFFGEQVLRRFPFFAVEDEMRLLNPYIRDHYLTKIFSFARFRHVQAIASLQQLLQFHTENKLLLMGYSQKELKILGSILANQNKYPLSQVFADYETHLRRAFFKAPRYTSQINVLDHAFGYISQDLSTKEKQFYASLLQKYRNNQVPFSVATNLVRSWVLRFEQPYLLGQTFFQPYPDALLNAEAIKTNDERDFWK